jgi:outer membrane protein
MKAYLVLVLVASFAIANAQENKVLTFKEAVRLGLENNVTLNQEKNRLEYTQINKTASKLQLGPSVQASGNAYHAQGNSFNPNTGNVIEGQIDYVNASVDASMPVFNGLRVLNQYRQANEFNESQMHFVNRSSQNVIVDVANQYLTCLLDIQLVRIDMENVNAQQVQYEQIKAQAELGSRAEADLYNQEYQLKNAELSLVRSRNRLKNDLAALAQIIMVDPAVAYDLQSIDWDVNKAVADTLSLPEMMTTAMQRRSDLKSAELNEKSAEYGFKSFKGRYYPSIYAGASYGSRFNDVYGESDRSFVDQITVDNTQFSYGVSVTIPIYNGLLFRSQAANSKMLYKNAGLVADGVETRVKVDVIRAYQNFKDAITNYQASTAQLKSAEMAFKMEKERYDLGISSIVQLSLVNQTYVKAQGDYQGSLFTLMFQRLLINYSLGTLSFEDIP